MRWRGPQDGNEIDVCSLEENKQLQIDVSRAAERKSSGVSPIREIHLRGHKSGHSNGTCLMYHNVTIPAQMARREGSTWNMQPGQNAESRIVRLAPRPPRLGPREGLRASCLAPRERASRDSLGRDTSRCALRASRPASSGACAARDARARGSRCPLDTPDAADDLSWFGPWGSSVANLNN